MTRRLVVGCAIAAMAGLLGPALGSSASGPPAPGSPEYIQRDNQNILDAYGRQTGPNGQLSPQYISELPGATNPAYLAQIAQQAANPTRLALDPGNVFPGWNQGSAYRASWPGKRGVEIPIAFTNRYGALLRGHVWAPLRGARDPYTGAPLPGPYPAVVITTGSIQGSEIMYAWLAEDLAERGYVVITYDVQGQGTSETLPHQGPAADFPYCDPSSTPAPGEMSGCPGVPFQQTANFVYGTEDATTFMLSTPKSPYVNRAAGMTKVNPYNPLWASIDHRPDSRSLTPGRTTRVAIIGHSLGAGAVSFVQAVDPRAETVVAFDKLGSAETFSGTTATPAIPALAVQSEYGFNVVPYWMMGGSSFSGQPRPPNQAPDPTREAKTGFDGWMKAGVDSMLIVPRASTHLEYTDINYALPASRYGQDFTSVYVQAWLDKYLKHDPSADGRLLATSWSYLEPSGQGRWSPVQLNRADRLSFYFCSGYAFHSSAGDLLTNRDIAKVGCP
jgi:dienelactone hydrolase